MACWLAKYDFPYWSGSEAESNRYMFFRLGFGFRVPVLAQPDSDEIMIAIAW
ncbi:hypothetical protein SAMN05216387_101254 [Nitrosovibrio tenuis]|uniref:Uncharacterized protein n=1 Tax=Nitrosovibrio tenuis TaxID=1233 RepID=A0A1H7GED5_9PROT|nr:hypothetical protein SAMN05216387_101254 [Nitrosovibrio tenuis]